jgi:hypothetical protein
MSDKIPAAKPAAAEAPVPGAVPPVRRHPGHRGADVRDTVAEMAAKAHEISMEAGSKMAAAMKDVINAAAGLTSFAIESSRDLVQYMVRRGQMTQEEADKLIREAEDAWSKKHKGMKPPGRVHPQTVVKPLAPSSKPAAPAQPPAHKPAAPAHKPASPAPKPQAAKPSAPAKKKAPPAKPKPPAKKPVAAAKKKPATKK